MLAFRWRGRLTWLWNHLLLALGGTPASKIASECPHLGHVAHYDISCYTAKWSWFLWCFLLPQSTTRGFSSATPFHPWSFLRHLQEPCLLIPKLSETLKCISCSFNVFNLAVSHVSVDRCPSLYRKVKQLSQSERLFLWDSIGHSWVFKCMFRSQGWVLRELCRMF